MSSPIIPHLPSGGHPQNWRRLSNLVKIELLLQLAENEPKYLMAYAVTLWTFKFFTQLLVPLPNALM